MTELVNQNYIRVNENLSSQQDAFDRIATIAVEEGLASSKQEVIDGLRKREHEGTTGFMDGFAIPHTKSPAVLKPGVIVLTAPGGIEWKSMDDKPATFIISLLIPESEAGTTHLTLLSQISRMLIHNDIRQNLLNAETTQQIHEQFSNALATI